MTEQNASSAFGEQRERAGGLRLIRTALIVVTVGVVLNSGGWVWSFNQARQSKDSLCALRADLERRVKSSEQFLVEHPRGIPGISAKTIRDGIDNQLRTIRALQGLSCPTE